MSPQPKVAANTAEPRKTFEDFLRQYKALEAEKEKLMLDFLRRMDEAVASRLAADLRRQNRP